MEVEFCVDDAFVDEGFLQLASLLLIPPNDDNKVDNCAVLFVLCNYKVENTIFVATRTEIQQFLNDFFAKYRVFGILFRDFRQKNSRALLTLEISPGKRKEIIESLKVEDYSEGPLDDNLYGVASMWVFGKLVNQIEVYIKISLGGFGAHVVCISFHDAEHAMNYPFKNVQS